MSPHDIQELVVISGKGGTGKTSLTASLAQCFEHQVLVDCDVDAADLHLLLPTRESQTQSFYGGFIAQIDDEKCTQCGRCAQLCRFDAIESTQTGYQVKENTCEGCKVCVSHCPQQAIQWIEHSNGHWMQSSTDVGPMFHARLTPGAENSGKLVTHIRQVARQHAQQHHIHRILVDGPPGIGCPVIASITGASEVLIVTEPTPSGHHDLERVLKLCQHFRIPAYTLINKADLNATLCQMIEQTAEHYGARMLGTLDYTPLFSQAQLQGKTLLEAFPHSPQALSIRSLAATLQQTQQTHFP